MKTLHRLSPLQESASTDAPLGQTRLVGLARELDDRRIPIERSERHEELGRQRLTEQELGRRATEQLNMGLRTRVRPRRRLIATPAYLVRRLTKGELPFVEDVQSEANAVA